MRCRILVPAVSFGTVSFGSGEAQSTLPVVTRHAALVNP
jgi:hypothetical protein